MLLQTDESEKSEKFSSNKKKETSENSITSSSSSNEAWLRSEGRMDYESYMI